METPQPGEETPEQPQPEPPQPQPTDGGVPGEPEVPGDGSMGDEGVYAE